MRLLPRARCVRWLVGVQQRVKLGCVAERIVSRCVAERIVGCCVVGRCVAERIVGCCVVGCIGSRIQRSRGIR